MADFKEKADAAKQAVTESSNAAKQAMRARADAAKQAVTESSIAAKQAMRERADAAKEAMQQALEKLDHTGWFRRRVLGATRYSLHGLKACFKNEEAFRTEVFLVMALLPAAYFISLTLTHFLLMFASMLLILIAELLNSAIEAAVDRTGKDFDEFAKHAKDFGSAAVFMTLLLFVVVWGSVIWLRFWGGFPLVSW